MIGVLLFLGVICVVLVLHFVNARSSEAVQLIPSLRPGSATKGSTDRAFRERDPDLPTIGQPDRSGEDAPVMESIAVK